MWPFTGAAHDADLAGGFAALCGELVYQSQKTGCFTVKHFPFRRIGIYPFHPREYLNSLASQTKPTSLTLLPLLLSPSLASDDLPYAPVLNTLVHSPALADPLPISAKPCPPSREGACTKC